MLLDNLKHAYEQVKKSNLEVIKSKNTLAEILSSLPRDHDDAAYRQDIVPMVEDSQRIATETLDLLNDLANLIIGLQALKDVRQMDLEGRIDATEKDQS